MHSTGFEPATLGLKVRCSDRLSYESFMLYLKFINLYNIICKTILYKFKYNYFI